MISNRTYRVRLGDLARVSCLRQISPQSELLLPISSGDIQSELVLCRSECLSKSDGDLCRGLFRSQTVARRRARVAVGRYALRGVAERQELFTPEPCFVIP